MATDAQPAGTRTLVLIPILGLLTGLIANSIPTTDYRLLQLLHALGPGLFFGIGISVYFLIFQRATSILSALAFPIVSLGVYWLSMAFAAMTGIFIHRGSGINFEPNFAAAATVGGAIGAVCLLRMAMLLFASRAGECWSEYHAAGWAIAGALLAFAGAKAGRDASDLPRVILIWQTGIAAVLSFHMREVTGMDDRR